MWIILTYYGSFDITFIVKCIIPVTFIIECLRTLCGLKKKHSYSMISHKLSYMHLVRNNSLFNHDSIFFSIIYQILRSCLIFWWLMIWYNCQLFIYDKRNLFINDYWRNNWLYNTGMKYLVFLHTRIRWWKAIMNGINILNTQN